MNCMFARASDMLKRGARRVLDIVYPDSIYCIGCGAIIDKTRPYSLCDACREKFHFATGKTCMKCGRILGDDYPHLLCNDCIALGEDVLTAEDGIEHCALKCEAGGALDQNGGHVFDRGFTCLMYGLYEKEMVRAFKYHDRPYYAKHLGEMMYDRIALEDIEIDMVVPVPLHDKKLRKRGYNQAELLASEVARRMGKPMVKALVRTKFTKPMSKLTREERLGNLVDIFAVPPRYTGAGVATERTVENADCSEHPSDNEARHSCKSGILQGQRILLIDDIYTTGSTADACSAALKAAGASTVYVFTLAAGGNPPPLTDD